MGSSISTAGLTVADLGGLGGRGSRGVRLPRGLVGGGGDDLDQRRLLGIPLLHAVLPLGIIMIQERGKHCVGKKPAAAK